MAARALDGVGTSEGKAATTRLYAQLAERIADMIRTGGYKVGDRLPSERELSLSYDVSRPTIREAIIALEVDGLVEVRVGSGVYVRAPARRLGKPAIQGVGPFELLEARRAIEGEACALAADRVTDADVAALNAILAEMIAAGEDFVAAERADWQFHLTIARITQNSAIISSVEALWEARFASPQQQLLADKAHDAGVVPRIGEHRDIISALATRDGNAARAAMRGHLTRVLEELIIATEVREAALLNEKMQARRRMFSVD
ncbi:FadR/GntR family transcriptional regulator [Sphingomonas sp.]|uniref:FadR/GntR family transcriptional regulator n=1 Tax=Sphingomonas sp. TaxID=28214 RepID=UPI003B3B2BE7